MARGAVLVVLGAAFAIAAPGCSGDIARSSAAAEEAIEADPADDAALERRLTAIYSELDDFRYLRVRVRNGVAHLTGTTDTVGIERRAVELAERLEGVVYVDNQITLDTHLLEQLAPGMHRLRGALRATITFLPLLIGALLVFAVFVVLARLAGRWRHPLRRLGVRRLTGNLITSALRALLVLVGLWIALQILGVAPHVGAVLGAVGLVAVVASLAFRDWVQNYMPGLLLGLHPPFSTGDLVRLGEHEGRVVRITPRATVLLTTDGDELRIPNSDVYREPLINFSQHQRRRLRFTMPLSPRAVLRDAHELGRRALLAVPGVLAEPPPFMRTRSLERDTVEVEYFAWVDQERADFRSVESRARTAVFEALTHHRVPRPTDTLTVRIAGDAEDRDREVMDELLARARNAEGERDLLEEGRPRQSVAADRRERRA